MPKTISMPFGRALEHKPEHPERTAFKSGKAFGAPMTFREWSNRAAMAKTMRLQQSRESRLDDWKPCIPLMDAEGHDGYQAKTLDELQRVFQPGSAYVWMKREGV